MWKFCIVTAWVVGAIFFWVEVQHTIRDRLPGEIATRFSE